MKFSKKNTHLSRTCEGCKIDKEKGGEYHSKTNQAEKGKADKSRMT